MKVKELIELLQKQNENANVTFVSGSGITWTTNLNAVDVKNTKDNEQENFVLYMK